MTATTTLRPGLLCVGLSVAVLAAGCGDGQAASDEPEVGIYAAALLWLLDGGTGGEEGASFEGTVYVEAVGDEEIPLEVQAGVVARLEDVATVRFIDDREEAIDTSDPGDPVRRQGLLVGLGPVPSTEPSRLELYVDRYVDVEHVVAYELVLERSNRRWGVVGRPERVSVRERSPGD